MPRPNFENFVPHVYRTLLTTDIDDLEIGEPDTLVVETERFIPTTAEQLHRCLNRVSEWSISIRLKCFSPDDTFGEYQTFVGTAVWDRSAYHTDENHLHFEPQTLSDPDNPGRDIYISESPTSGSFYGTNVLTRFDDGGMIDSGPTFFQFAFQAFCYVGDWSTGGGGIMLDINITGLPWVHGGGDDFTARNFTAGANTVGFIGSAPSDFKLVGNLAGGSVGVGFPSTGLEQNGQTYHVEMTPTSWYPYTLSGIPKFNTSTGEPI